MPVARLSSSCRAHVCPTASRLRTVGPRCPPCADGRVRRLPSIRAAAAAVAALVASLACASTGSSVANEPQPGITTRQLSSPGSRPIESTDVNSTDFVPVKGTPTEAMTALTQIYAQLQIPISTMLQDAGQIGNQNIRIFNHRLAGHAASTYLDCGQESMMGSRADLDELFVSIMTIVKRGPDSTTVVGTQITGTARPNGTSSNPVDCQTTGELEKTIATKLQSALGVPTPKSE